MRIVLSRKGFDSQNGGMPSPILPNEKAFSFPIPASRSPHRFQDLVCQGYSLSEILADLGIDERMCVHLDPDIACRVIPERPIGWRGALGQVGTAQAHLKNQNVGTGDLFLFFGWFKKIERRSGKWRFVPDAPDLHVIYGWLLVEEVLSVFGNEELLKSRFEWLKHHPHLHADQYAGDATNTIYIGSNSLESIGLDAPGFGVFDKVQEAHILTDTTQNNRSLWRLPACLMPTDRRPPLSYHGHMRRWKLMKDGTTGLKSVGRGQEFVLDAESYPGALKWVATMFG